MALLILTRWEDLHRGGDGPGWGLQQGWLLNATLITIGELALRLVRWELVDGLVLGRRWDIGGEPVDLLLRLLQRLVLVLDQWEVGGLLEERAVFNVLVKDSGSCLQAKCVECVQHRWHSVLVNIVGG